MIRLAAIPALIALAACAPQQTAPAPEAAAPAPAPTGPVATVQENGVIRVTALIPNQDELAAVHCTAAKQAIANGASAMEWVGGVAKPTSGEDLEATFAYETTFDKKLRRPKPGVEPADGGLVAAESWLNYCDEAGLPRTDEA